MGYDYLSMIQIQWQLSWTNIEIMACKSDYISQFYVDVITYPCVKLCVRLADLT